MGIRAALVKYGDGYKKGRIRNAVAPYFKALREGGISREDIEYLVNNNLSLYEKYLPAAWKKALLRKAASIAPWIDTSEDTIRLFVDAVSDEIPWFAEVVSRDKIDWVRRELYLLIRDIKANS